MRREEEMPPSSPLPPPLISVGGGLWAILKAGPIGFCNSSYPIAGLPQGRTLSGRTQFPCLQNGDNNKAVFIGSRRINQYKGLRMQPEIQ